MNRIYGLVWCDRHNTFQPVPETTSRRGKRSGGGKAVLGSLIAGAVSVSAYGAGVTVAPTALPTAPQVTLGHASVATKGNQMLVTESTSRAAINWGTFNIGSSAGVTFVQPSSSSIILNRVLSGDPSKIYGTLTANGNVFLINPQGIVVGRGAEVNVGGLVASTLALSDRDFLAGNFTFTATSASGAVSNAGAIHVAPGGFAALIGAKVDNTGSIAAKLGSVALASGNQVTLDYDEGGLLKIAVKQAALDAMVSNSGAIVADGGRIILTAKSAGDVLGTVVNNTGVLQAQTLGMREGQIWLLSADPLDNTGANGAAANAGSVHDAAGGVVSSGQIDVSGHGDGGGQVTLAGTTVALTGAIKAGDAASGAGRVLIDSTQASTLEAGSLIDVSGAAAAGKVVVWSDGSTKALGAIDGRGIGAHGAGARVEVSAAHDLTFDADVTLGATTAGHAGTLILDPATLEIAAGSGSGSANKIYQSALQTQSGNIVLSATGQITVDALNNNLLDLASATGLSITSQSSGGINFLNGAGGGPSGISTHHAPVTLTASGSGSIDNVGAITTTGGNIDLSGVYVHLAGGLNATNGLNAAGDVAISVFGGGILSASASALAGGHVLLDATYGYVGASAAPVSTATSHLTIKTGGNAYVANTGALTALALTSNHLEGTPVGIAVTATNLVLTGADAQGNGTAYSNAVRSTQYSASDPSISLAAPAAVTIAEDGNLAAGSINLPQTAVSLASSQGYILGGNSHPILASSLNLASPLGIGGTDFNGINAETDSGNPGARGGNTLLTQAGSITANVLDPAGNIAGIANLTQQGNFVGSVQANKALLQSTGNMGGGGQPLALNLGTGGEAFNIAAGGYIYLAAGLVGAATFDNVQTGGSLTLLATQAPGSQGAGSTFINVAAAGNLNVAGVQNSAMAVRAATSTNGSINISNDNNVEVDAATLNGTDAAGRSINLTSNDGTVIFGLLSTRGPTGSAAASTPLGSISIAAPLGSIYDLAYWEDAPQSELRAGAARLAAMNDIQLYDTAVDAHTPLTLISGLPGNGNQIYANLAGIDSVTDPTGASAHPIHLVSATSYYGDVNVRNRNGDLRVGSVRSYYDYNGGSSSGSIELGASGSIVADGSVGGGRINAADLDGNGGSIALNAGASLGLRGSGAGGTAGAVYLSLSANSLDLTTGGNLFAKNDQSHVNDLNLHLDYASSAAPYIYDFTSADTAQVQATVSAAAFNASSSGGLLTLSSGSIGDGAGGVRLYADGDVRVRSFQAGQSDSLGIYGQNIAIDAPVNNTPALSMGDNSWLQINANGSLTVGHLASTGSSPGDSYVGLSAYGGNLTLGKVDAANATVEVYANHGDILGSAGNQVFTNDLNLTNSFGAIGADPLVSGSVPINIGVAQNLSISNQGGGGGINLVTLNDPRTLNLTLYNSNALSYAGANFLIAPSTAGLGLSGSAGVGVVTLTSLGTTGGNATAVPVSITSDTPSLSINSGAGAQLGIGYDLYFGSSYQSVVANLSGSAGQWVTVHTDNSSSQMSSLTGTMSLTNLQLATALYSYGSPLTVDLNLAQPLNAFTLLRSGNDSDPTSFNGNSIALSGSGQSFTAVETPGIYRVAPGVITVNAASLSALDLAVNLRTAGIIDVGTIDLGQQGSVSLSGQNGYRRYPGVASAIEGVDGNNSITAAIVNLSATGTYAGQATLGTAATALNVNAADLALTSSGDVYVNTGGTLSSLAMAVSHPIRDPNNQYTGNSSNYTYQLTGITSLTAVDNAGSTATSIGSFTSSTPLNFSFTADRTIQVGTINVGSGNVTLTANGSWTRSPFYNYTGIGIEQVSGSGITAGGVALNANGYRGHAGTTGTALKVDAANLSVNVNGDINVADASALDALSLTLAHGYDPSQGYRPNNSYAITAPNIALTLADHYNDGYGAVTLQNLVSSSLQSFSLRLSDANLAVGNDGNFAGGQVSLGSGATVSLSASGSIWGAVGGGGNSLNDSAGSAVADSAVAIKAGTLNLTAGGSVTFSTYGSGDIASNSLPVEVDNLTVSTGGSAYVTNVGNLNVVSTNIGGSGYLRAVEAAPATSASITGGSIAAPLTAGDLTLVAYYGDIGVTGTPVITNTPSLSLDSGADIYAANLSQLSALSIISHHNKGSIGDISNNGLNTLTVTDGGTSGGIPLQLGVTDLGINGGGYQLSGLNAPQLDLSFQTDTSISVGSLSASRVALISESGSILHIPLGGTITAGTVALTASNPGESVGAPGENILVNAANLSVNTGGNMYVADSATLDSLRFGVYEVQDLAGVAPVYLLDNSASAHPLTFDVTADAVNPYVLDVNSIVVSRTDAPVSIGVFAEYSSVGVNQIKDDVVSGGSVAVSSYDHNIFSLGASPAGISASSVSLSNSTGNIGDDSNGNSAPLVVTADTVSASSFGDIRITSPQAIANLTLQQGYYYDHNATSVWTVVAPSLTLNGGYDGTAGTLDLPTVTAGSTNLTVDAYSNIAIGTLHLGSGAFTLNSYYGAIDSDASNGSAANISTTGNVDLQAFNGIGTSPSTQIQTDIGGSLYLGTSNQGAINVDQVSTTPLLISNLSTPNWSPASPFNITAVSSLTLLNGLNAGTGTGSAVTLTAGGDITYTGTQLTLNGAPITLSAGGSILGGDIWQASSASLTAAGTAAGSTGGISIGGIDYSSQYAAGGAITLQAAGDVNLSGQLMSNDSVSINSATGSIYSQSNGTFGRTPILSLTAQGDIGLGSGDSFGQWQLNGLQDRPGTLTLSAQAGGQISFLSYSAVDATQLVGGGNVSLQILGGYQGSVGEGISFGQVSSTNGGVNLVTANGDITAAGISSAITAATSITLTASQNNRYYYSNMPVGQAFNLGSAGAPLSLTAPQINLTANGDIYATVPTTGLTELSVARTYVPRDSSTPNNQTVLMPASTVLIHDTGADTVLSVADGGWAQGGWSAIDAAYGAALNLSYAGNNAIHLGTVTLDGGNLSLQATNPYDISITSAGGLIQANAFNFNLVDSNQWDGMQGTASGGFGTLANPIHTQIASLSGTTVGATAGVFMNQDGSITFTSLTTGGDIAVTTTRLGGALSANADIAVGNVTSNGGSVSFSADGAIVAADGVAAPSIAANGPSNTSNVSLAAAAGITLASSSITSSNGQVALTADQGDVTIGSIIAHGAVTLTAATGAINGTPAAQNLTGLANGITAGSDVILTAATGIGTAVLPLSVSTLGDSGDTITANTTGVGADIHLVTGGANPGSQARFDASAGGAITLDNYYSALMLDGVQSQGDIKITQQNYHGQIVLDNVAASGPGATLAVVALYGNIASSGPSGTVSASRIVLNALGDASGGTLGLNFSPVNVDADVVIAVASGDIALNSVAAGVTKMPLVASNGDAPTISITSAGDFLVGQIVAGRQGTVNLTSAANLYDDGDTTTRIYGGTINLTAADAIGAAQTPIQLTATAYDNSGAAQPGDISAASTAVGNIYLNQQGDAVLTSLTAADGSINVTVSDPVHGQTSLLFADTTATDHAGNDINVVVTNGDLTVARAQSGMTAGAVNLAATAGSIYGDGRTDCCTTPNVSGESVNLDAQTNIGSISSLVALSGTAVGIEANQSAVTTHANGSQIYLQFTGDATLGGSSPLSVTPLGSGAQVLLAACGILTLDGLNLGNASVGLNAGMGGSGGSVRDGINGGSSLANPDVTAASVTFGAATNVGAAGAALWANAGSIGATAGNGGVWINSAASTPVTLTSVTAGAGPVVIGGRGNLLVDSVNAGTDGATLTSANGAVLDGHGGGANASHPNVIAGSVTLDAATKVGGSSGALWVDAATVSATAAGGGVWIRDAATAPVTLASVIAGAGPVVIGSQGDLLVDSVNAGSGSATLTSGTGAVLDGIDGGSNASHPNVIAGAVTVNAATDAGNPNDALWVNAASISAAATSGGIWINDAATTPVTLASVASGAGPVVIGSQGSLLLDSVNAGGFGATLSSATGAVLDGIGGGSTAGHPNVTATAVTINAATNVGGAGDALWVNATTITAAARGGGVWISDAATPTVTLASVTAGAGPVVVDSQGSLSVASVDAGRSDARLSSAHGAVLDGHGGGANASHPNVTAGSVTLDAATKVGGSSGALWVDAATVSATAAGGGVWIRDAATAPVTLASVTAGAGPVVIGSQGDLLVDSVNAGSGSATLSSGTGAVLDGIGGGSNASHPNVTARTVTVNAATSAGNVNAALWVDAATISAAAAGGGVWIKDAAATPVTLASVRAGAGPVVIGSQGNLLIESVNAGGGSATLTSGTGAVLDGIGGGSNASHPNVIARTVTVNAATNVGDPNDALWVNAATIYATATNGGVWINDAATTPVTLASVTAHAGPIVIHAQGDLDLLSVDAGSGGATLSSATGSILDAISGGATSSDPNVRAGTVTLTAANTIGLISDPIWVDAASYTANAPKGHWVNVPPVLTPYPDLPLLVGVSPVTVYEANAQAQILPPQQLPITLIGQPMRMAPPIAVTADLFGIALPAGVGANATQQDASMGTAIVPIYGGNDDEIGRKKATLRLKKNSDGRSTQNIVKTIKSEI